jgi:folylpolyglutamate synthase/dihydropteroate synthase
MELRALGDIPLLFDVAHNPAAVNRLVAALPGMGFDRWTFVAGILADKRWEEMVDALLRYAPRGRLCGLATANPGRRLSAPEAAAAIAARPGIGWAESVAEGLAAARADVEAGLADAIVVTGSFHTVGEALLALGFATEGEPYERPAARPPVATRGGVA